MAAQRLSFERTLGPAPAADDRRLIHYRMVHLSDRPDEVLGVEIGRLDEGDEVEVLGASVGLPSGQDTRRTDRLGASDDGERHAFRPGRPGTCRAGDRGGRGRFAFADVAGEDRMSELAIAAFEARLQQVPLDVDAASEDGRPEGGEEEPDADVLAAFVSRAGKLNSGPT